MAMCDAGGSTERPTPERFGEDGADVDALSEVLFDPDRWPVFRVPAADGPGAVVVYRNLPGDYGIDCFLTRPDRGCARQIAGREGERAGTGLTWLELIRIAGSPAPTAEGAEDPDARLLLLLPSSTTWMCPTPGRHGSVRPWLRTGPLRTPPWRPRSSCLPT